MATAILDDLMKAMILDDAQSKLAELCYQRMSSMENDA